jgi:esterase/lipase
MMEKREAVADATASLFRWYLRRAGYEPVAAAGATSFGGLVAMAITIANMPKAAAILKAAPYAANRPVASVG